MTDKELRDAAVAELKLTTAGWRKPNGSPNYPSGTAPMTTHWGKAMALLEQIGGTVEPPPPPPPPPTGLRFALGSTSASDPSAITGQSLSAKLMRTPDTDPEITVAGLNYMLTQYQSRGIEPYILFNTAQMNSNMNELPGNLAALAAALGPGGTQAHATLAPTYWEIGNEQFYKYVSKPGPEYADEYTTGWLRAWQAIKNANPNCKVLFTIDTDGGGTTQYNRIAELMYQVDPLIHQKVDGWVFHHYGPITSGHTGKVLGMLDAVEAKGAPTTIPVMFTEDGIPSQAGFNITNGHGWPVGARSYATAATQHGQKLTDLRNHARIGPRLRIWTIWVARNLAVEGAQTDGYYYMGTTKIDGSAKGEYSTWVRNTASAYP